MASAPRARGSGRIAEVPRQWCLDAHVGHFPHPVRQVRARTLQRLDAVPGNGVVRGVPDSARLLASDVRADWGTSLRHHDPGEAKAWKRSLTRTSCERVAVVGLSKRTAQTLRQRLAAKVCHGTILAMHDLTAMPCSRCSCWRTTSALPRCCAEQCAGHCSSRRKLAGRPAPGTATSRPGAGRAAPSCGYSAVPPRCARPLRPRWHGILFGYLFHPTSFTVRGSSSSCRQGSNENVGIEASRLANQVRSSTAGAHASVWSGAPARSRWCTSWDLAVTDRRIHWKNR